MAVQKFRRYNLSGSQVSNINPLTLKEEDAELLRNVTTENLGVWKKRSGTKLRGNQPTDDADVLGIHYYEDSAGNTASTFVVMDDDGSSPTNSDIYIQISSTLNGAITTSSTTITLANASSFASSGTIEIDGDLITYTGKSSNDLTGCSGITYNHATGLTVRQWKKSLTDDTKSLRTRFTDFLDSTIRVNGTDDMKCYNGSWYTTGNPINPQQATAASLIEVFNDRVHLAGGALFPDRLYASSLPSTAGNISWTTSVSVIDKVGTNSFYIDINPEDESNITALERNGANLLIFKERQLYTWNGSATQPEPLIEVGAVSQEAVITTQMVTFFLGRSKKNLGIYAYTGSYPKLISRRVKKWVDKIDQSDLTKIKTGADEDNVMFYIGDISFTDDDIYGTRSFSDVWLVYTISQDSWKVYTGLNATNFGYITSSGQELLVFGNNDGKLFELGQGTTDDSGDSQTPIQMEIITKEEPYGAPELPIELRDMNIVSRSAYGTTVKYKYDRRDDWKSLGELDGRFTSLDAPEYNDSTNRGHTIQYQFTDYSKYQASIDGFTSWVDLGTEVDETEK